MVDIQALQQRARALTLGPEFKPREENIDTPPILLEKLPELEGQLKLVGMDAQEALDLKNSSSNEALGIALLVCACLRFRDAASTPYFAMSDAPTLLKQDMNLLSALGSAVSAFLGFAPAALDDAKNDLGATPKNAGGGESPSSPAAAPPEIANDPSTVETSLTA